MVFFGGCGMCRNHINPYMYFRDKISPNEDAYYRVSADFHRQSFHIIH